MLDLHKSELIAIACLVAGLFAWASFSSSKNLRFGGDIRVEKFDAALLPASISSAEGRLISGKININTSDSEKLASLNGIGRKTARRIVEYREHNGSFLSIEEIKKVKGVGESVFAKIKENIRIE